MSYKIVNILLCISIVVATVCYLKNTPVYSVEEERGSAKQARILSDQAPNISGVTKGVGPAIDKVDAHEKLVSKSMKLMESSPGSYLREYQAERAIDETYSLLFKRLKLNPLQTNQLRALLANRALIPTDTAIAIKSLGLGAPIGSEAAVLSDEKIESEIKSLIGAEQFSVYLEYKENASIYEQVTRIQQSMRNGPHPLNDDQAVGLANFIIDNKIGTSELEKALLSDASLKEKVNFLRADQFPEIASHLEKQEIDMKLAELPRE